MRFIEGNKAFSIQIFLEPQHKTVNVGIETPFSREYKNKLGALFKVKKEMETTPALFDELTKLVTFALQIPAELIEH